MAKPGPKPKEISPAVQGIILSLMSAGDSDRRIRSITGIQSAKWQALAKKDKQFKALLDEAKEQRAGGLGGILRNAMITNIKRGHPWWAKLAIHNYATGLRDPDVVGGGKLKKMIDRIAQRNGTNSELLTTDPALASAAIPPGATPGVEPPGEVQDDPRGPAVGEDGTVREAQAGPVAVGLPDQPPPVG